ncbi:hypothetical protein VT06_12920 [Arsukibacterium sp. MJ3]|uniref:hypothetical protein n=1 Tax=Arsukibacterium sp. MJ3 TaxID=1632859 RepID=UPI000626F141|nr:hypothetical protein [Arsukibacterium sp. MJ3]KKO48142.1 hypothetical protein VT06_12920 [Arsukibacterium sp. MJ3]
MATLDEQITGTLSANTKRFIKIAIFVAAAILLALMGALVFKSMPTAPLPADKNASGMPSVISETPGGTALDEDIRSALQQLLSDTNSRIKAISEDPQLSQWKTNVVQKMQNDVQKAYQLYGQQLYNDAANLLSNLTQQVDTYHLEFTDAYEQAHSAAIAAFEQGNLTQAKLYNNQSLDVNPVFKPAHQLQNRLNVAEDVLVLWGKIKVAELENNLSKQKTLLQQILQLDNADQAAVNHLAVIDKSQRQQAFSQALADAIAALEGDNYLTARDALNRARSIDSKRPELKSVQQKLDAAEQSASLDKVNQQVEIFSTADEWPTVKLLASKALATAPDNTRLQQRLRQAEQVISAKERLSSFIQQSERLTDPNIQRLARAAIADVEPLNSLSPKLAAQQDQLKQLLQIQQQEIAITLLSDNRTEIRVLGVGNVGKVREKTIQLPPGSYQFEGVCEGYRTEIINVEVSADTSSAAPQVQLQCKVRI